VGLGVGIGVPLGVLSVILAVLVYREHKRRILENELSGAVFNSPTRLIAQADTAKELDAPKNPSVVELGGGRPPELG
jgi:hypothetical protein